LEYVAVIEKKFKSNLKYLWFDNGKELVNQRLRDWAAKKGITIETSAPYSLSQNGIAEHFNRTLLELAQVMLIMKNLSIFLWDEAVIYVAYL
jgi:transposase InsO family protein